MRSDPSQAIPNPSDPADPGAAIDPAAIAAEPDSAALIEQLRQDRLWLLRQIDSGLWAEWRLDLAALERELGLLLEQARERLIGS
ncbi:MAG: hypothetical protein WAM11_15815 [Cyanobium sp.]